MALATGHQSSFQSVFLLCLTTSYSILFASSVRLAGHVIS